MRGKPIFQYMLEQVEQGKPLQQVFSSVIYADEQCIVFSPSGFKGRPAADKAVYDAAKGDLQQIADGLTKTPLTMNPVSQNHGQAVAG